MMESQCVFIDKIDCMPPDVFLRHFLTRRNVACPDPPKATEAQLENAKKIVQNRFDLIGEEVTLRDGFSWKESPSHDKEWQIAQHKFYFAVDLIQAYRHDRDPVYLKKWISLIDSWLEEMGSGYIAASDAQVEAKRIEHWVNSFLLLRGLPCEPFLTAGFLRRWLARIAEETRYISTHLKPVRNHRTFQLYSVFLVGVVFPEFRLHSDFLETGGKKLTENLLTDFLGDGVHVELSTHYHQLVLETALSFIEWARLNCFPLDDLLLDRLHRALAFSMYMQWPNGDIPLINDSDNGDHLELLRRGGRLFHNDRLLWAGTLGREGIPPESPSRHFSRSGYFVFSDGWGEDPATYARRQHVFYDCALLGEGSHSHYDLFSFCYYVNGEPAIIDPGRYTYSSDPDPEGIDWRGRFKSTAFHNTVSIDGKDQTRYLSRTKHGPEVEIAEKAFSIGMESDWVSAQARSAEYSPRHTRLFIYMCREYLFVHDDVEIEDGVPHNCALSFHLSEKWDGLVYSEASETEWVVRTPLLQVRSHRAPDAALSIESGWVSRQYGVKRRAPVIRITRTAAQSLSFTTVLAPTASPSPLISAMNQAASPAEKGCLFRVDGMKGGEPFHDWYLFPDKRTAYLQTDRLVFRGGFLAFRQNRSGKIVHLLAHGAESIQIEGVPHWRSETPKEVEWSFGRSTSSPL
ncbi:hypothetical protein MNODULE_23720 [Nitrospiraceae bacterium HYJII51-Mn-bac16s-1-B09]|uniref:Heparin-sulfate lyase N-terminal domain-containing protein n=2 Tax=Candidatus Manganitrophus noduliformans TaxID=2606439 RepID=A0A7X6IDJ4_9BACT|nr:hypothetical protein [Candidatus Manganitrophus noduliformans]